MSPPSNFNVIIVGGGVAGLALANMLERFGLDYVLLEGQSSIAPEVGASIGMLPNGLRILDQLGCYEPIRKIFGGDAPYDVLYTRDMNGDVLSKMRGMSVQIEERHGYGFLFFDRQKLLEILYGCLRHKQRVLCGKRVIGLDLLDGGAKVTCADGSFFSGTIIVGADGIHSAVRDAMTALGNKLQPGHFDPREPDNVPCYYQCSFGIAQHVAGWVPSDKHLVAGEGRSQFVVSGPDDKVYWFLFEKLPETKYGKDIPKFTKEDEAGFVERNRDLPITRRITFGQVYNKRLSSTLTPLHEVTYKNWFFRRVVTLGDSAHKPNPISGQGANNAIESCAQFVNAILRTRDRRGGTLNNLTDEEVESIFTETQSSRHGRAERVVKDAHDAQALLAYEKPFISTVMLRILRPFVTDDSVLDMMSSLLAGSAKLERLPVPHRPRLIPFHDERPAEPIGEKTHRLVQGAFLGSMGLIVLLSTRAFRLPLEPLERWGSSAINLNCFSNTGVNRFLGVLISAFDIPIRGEDPSARVHLWNFLPQLVSPLLVYTIEGSRAGHRAGPLFLPSLFSVGMQVMAIGRVAPTYAAMFALFSHETPACQPVPTEVAKSLIPAITLGFVLPTVMMLSPTENMGAWHRWVGLWQFAPPLFNILVTAISSGLKKCRKHQQPAVQPKQQHSSRSSHPDSTPVLKSVYTYAFAVQSTAHIASLAYAWHHPKINLVSTFFTLPDPFKADWGLTNLGVQLAAFFRYDMALAVTAFVGSNLYSIWDLRRLGYIKTREAVGAALSVVAGQFVVGSGATWAGLWYWREGKIAGSS